MIPCNLKLSTFKGPVKVPNDVNPGALATVDPNAVADSTVTPFILYSLPVAKFTCSELLQAVVPDCHNSVLSVTDDFNTIPPPDTYESLPKGVPVIVANSMVLSSTLRSSTMADVPVPSIFKLP